MSEVDARLAGWRKGAVTGSSISLVAVLCLLVFFVQDDYEQPTVERATAEQLLGAKPPGAKNAVDPNSADALQRKIARLEGQIGKLEGDGLSEDHARAHSASQTPFTKAESKAAAAIKAVASQNEGVEAEVRSVIDQAESVDKEKATVRLAKKHGQVKVQGLAAKSKAKAKPKKPALSKETVEAMKEGEQAGWAADEAAKKVAEASAKMYYEQLRKEMYKEAAKHEAQERQDILKRHSLSTSEDNADLVHALDAVYRSDGPTSTRHAPPPSKIAVANAQAAKAGAAAAPNQQQRGNLQQQEQQQQEKQQQQQQVRKPLRKLRRSGGGRRQWHRRRCRWARWRSWAGSLGRWKAATDWQCHCPSELAGRLWFKSRALAAGPAVLQATVRGPLPVVAVAARVPGDARLPACCCGSREVPGALVKFREQRAGVSEG
eukprot:CAMPEP_0181305472 /NCGR_PEP_ID=MMETSP1101-20121128/9750_1 /TAXON_ID=46948 /ORGANISM="Rhodomonas abbreviata, Strain Caron Lab Isolate" /LENGTH=432 /DNA_ID=CAMNT_0023411395 /DNA_START=118 /DNA_END=1414 /DNA_ORIENTATION=+